MKDPEMHLSRISNPFDETDTSQEDLDIEGTLNFQKEEILSSITKKNSRHTFDIFSDDLIQNLSPDDKVVFVSECFERFIQTYNLATLYDKCNRETQVSQDTDLVFSCIEYICRDRWLDTLIPVIPPISLEIITSGERLYDYVKSNFKLIHESILKNNDIHELIRYEIEYAPLEESVNFLFKLIHKDIPGVVSVQLVAPKKEIEK